MLTRRLLAAAALTAAAIATTPAHAGPCEGRVDCALLAVECAVKLQPPCIYL